MLKKARLLTHPPTGTLRRAISPGEGLPILFSSLYEEWPTLSSPKIMLGEYWKESPALWIKFRKSIQGYSHLAIGYILSFPFIVRRYYSSYSHSRLHCERANLGQSVL